MKTRGLVDEVLRKLETALLDGTHPANARLPSERALAQQYVVSRNTIREAVQRLVARGCCAAGAARACSSAINCAPPRRRHGDSW